MLGILGVIAEFERDLIRERQAEGIARAKANGRYRGKKRKLDPGEGARRLPGARRRRPQGLGLLAIERLSDRRRARRRAASGERVT
jgi:DNA invertase Pin-like site-specific DNA recombinase